jgi:hypothetical protein
MRILGKSFVASLALALLQGLVPRESVATESAAESAVQHFRILGLSEPDRVEDLRHVFEATPGLTLESADFEKEEISVRIHPEIFQGKDKPGADPEALLKRLNQLVGQASRSTFKLAPRSAVPGDKLQKIEIAVGLLDCKGCRFGAYRAVAYLDGVERVKVSTLSMSVCAWVDPGKISRDALVAALKKARVEMPAE